LYALCKKFEKTNLKLLCCKGLGAGLLWGATNALMRWGHGKNSALFQRFSGGITYFYAMQKLLAMALISALVALSSLFVAML
jgi:hypothetical protein